MNGAPANPMSGTSPSSRHQQRHRLGDRRNLLRLKRFHRLDVGAAAHRMLDDRADVGHDVELDARRPQRHHDVGEQDGGVHPVPAHRLQGDLGDQLGVEAGLHHRVLGAQRPVLGQRTAGLAHEPHRHAAGFAAAGCGQIGRLGQLTAGTHRPPCCHGAVTRGSSAMRRRSRPACSRRSDADRRACARPPDGLASNGVTTAEPAQFREAVAAMNATTVRPEIELGPIRPPQRLAPFSYALGAEVRHPERPSCPSAPRATRSAG